MNVKAILSLGILSVLLLGGIRHEGYAQYRQNPHFLPYSSFGFGAGTSTYFGDLAPYGNLLKTPFTLPRWNVGLMFSRQFTPRLGARASFTYARLVGDDYTYNKNNLSDAAYAARFARNLHFRNDLKEFALIGTYDFKPGGRTPRNRPKLTPYLLAGIALVAHNPQALTSLTALAGETPNRSNQQWVSLQPLGTEGQSQPNYAKPYSLVTLSIPLGIGLKYALTESFNLAFEVRATPTFSDYIDDVGGKYPNPSDLTSPQAIEFSNRGFVVNPDGTASLKEPFSARTGESRLDGVNQITGLVDPNQLIRGGSSTIPLLRDSYLLTSIQIHYIIPAKIKCPPIR